MDSEALVAEWRKVYTEFVKHDLAEDQDFRSLCIGWCLAHGMTADEGYDFYQSMIPLELF